MRRLPRYLRIGAVSYRLSFNGTFKKRRLDGLFSPDERTIEVSPRLNRTNKALALVHECVHAIDETYNADLSEKQTDQWAFVVATLLVQNEELVKYIIDLFRMEEEKCE